MLTEKLLHYKLNLTLLVFTTDAPQTGKTKATKPYSEAGLKHYAEADIDSLKTDTGTKLAATPRKHRF